MGAQQEFNLHPDRMLVSEELPMIKIVLEADLRELGRVIS